MGLDVQRGCKPGRKAELPIYTRSAGEFDRCPKAWLREDAGEFQDYFADYRWLKSYKTMPKPGGKLEQSPRFIDAIDVIEAEIGRIEAKAIEGARRGHK